MMKGKGEDEITIADDKLHLVYLEVRAENTWNSIIRSLVAVWKTSIYHKGVLVEPIQQRLSFGWTARYLWRCQV